MNNTYSLSIRISMTNHDTIINLMIYILCKRLDSATDTSIEKPI